MNDLGFTHKEPKRLLKAQDDILSSKQTKKILILKREINQLEKLNELEFTQYFNITYLKHLHFDSDSVLQQALKNCPWGLKEGSIGVENRRLAHTYNAELNEGYIANVAIQWIDPLLGYGLFANEKICLGSYIGEFTGHVRTLSRWYRDTNPYCMRYPTRFFSWNYTVVDALLGGNETRFINHSDTPNLQPICLCDRGLLHIVFIAIKTIPPGTQLTFDYGEDFWKHRGKIPI